MSNDEFSFPGQPYEPDVPRSPRSSLHSAKPTERDYREALFRAAPSHQGGHSDTGAAIAECLGVGFPLDVGGLERKARSEGFDTRALWPWLYRLRDRETAQSAE